MTPGHARVALVGFALVLAGVTVNAIYLQDRQQAPAHEGARQASRSERKPVVAAPAPQGPRSGAAASEAPLRIARFGSDPPPVPTVTTSQASIDQETVRAIQRELAARGFGPVPSDGNLGLVTRAAIIAYEQDQRLALTATASEDLLRRLVLGTPTRTVAPGEEVSPGQVASPEAEAVIASVQRLLTQLGYQPGRADGQLREETTRAMHDFEVDRGMVPKGRISAELVRQLEAVQRAGGH
jgi:peptidoglycan hydrolase-like protein with peptidoglycan-binding domain